MTSRGPSWRALGAAVGAAALASVTLAQTPDTFTARLSWVPISRAEQALVGGEGEAVAMLSRRRLTISGSFEGLPTPATAARLHRGAATGARGPAIAELDVAGGADGTITGVVELDRADVAALVAGQLYIQLYAEHGVPPDDAVLRGWLLAPKAAPARGR
jgi:CHRD domain